MLFQSELTIKDKRGNVVAFVNEDGQWCYPDGTILPGKREEKKEEKENNIDDNKRNT